jgi:arginine repressor
MRYVIDRESNSYFAELKQKLDSYGIRQQDIVEYLRNSGFKTSQSQVSHVLNETLSDRVLKAANEMILRVERR